jgi:ATP-binding cassette subfamily B protein
MTQSFLEKYLNQIEVLPLEVRASLEEAVASEQVHAYAFIDLRDDLTFGKAWVIVTERHIAIAKPDINNFEQWKLQTFSLIDIQDFSIVEGMSSCRMRLISEGGKLFAEIYFTRRQSRSINRLQFIAIRRRTTLCGESVLVSDQIPSADESYKESVLYNLKRAEGMFFVPKMGVMWRLLSYLKPHKRTVLSVMFLGVLLTGLQLLPPYLTKVLVDDILRPTENGMLTDPSIWLWLVIGALAMVWSLNEIISFFRLHFMSLTGEKVASQIRLDVYNHMQRLSLSFFSSHPSGSLIARASSDTDRILEFFTIGLIDIWMAGLQIIGIATALLIQDWSLALLVLVPLPIIGIVFYLQGKQTQKIYIRIWRRWAALTAVLSDVIPGIRVVQAFAQEENETQRFRDKNKALEEESAVLHTQWSRFWPTVAMLMHLCTLIVWVVGAPRVLLYMQTGGAEGLPLGVFIAFTGYMWMFWGPVQQLGMHSRSINRVVSSAARIFEVLDTAPTILSKPGALKLAPIKGNVSFECVSFSYDGIRNAIEGVTFHVNVGEMIGIIGPSGSGKTTLVNLICRFYDPNSGLVKIDDVDARDLDLTTMRQQIGVVLQDPYLFHGTIAENITYGARKATPKDIINAAKAANAHEFVTSLPDGYETMIGERGQTLSGGERQRISIARAILHDPRVLILDEATSSVDTETEKKIQEALQRLVLGRTTFAIAHRLSTLVAADRLFIMEGGKLREQGTHEELLSKTDSVYARILQTQVQPHAT